MTSTHNQQNTLSLTLWNEFYYLSAIYFFFAFIFFNENNTEFGEQLFSILYNKHIELLILSFLLLRVCVVADAKECIVRMTFALLLACFTIGCYMEAGKINRIREIIIFGLIITASQIQLKRLIQWIFSSYIIITTIKVIGSLSGFGTEDGGIRPLTTRMDFGRGIIETRYQFGFSHPNVCHCAYFMLASMLLYLLSSCRMRIKYMLCGLLFVGNIILYLYTGSRTGLFIVIAVIIAYLLSPLLGKIKNRSIRTFTYILSQVLPFASASFTLFVGYIGLTSPRMYMINLLLTGRLALMHETMATTPLTFFGSKIGTTCDSNYIYTLYHCGIYVFLAYLLLHVILVHFLYKQNLYEVIAIVAIFDLYFMIECTMLSLNRNIIPFFMMGVLGSLWNHHSNSTATTQSEINYRN